MKISGGLENVNKIEATLTITMPLGDWLELKQQLATQYPSWKLGNAIGELWYKAKKEYDAKVPPEAV